MSWFGLKNYLVTSFILFCLVEDSLLLKYYSCKIMAIIIRTFVFLLM